MPAQAWTLTARWVFPVHGPPLERGTVTVAGTTLVAVEEHGRRTADLDLGNVALLPGLVNAHVHLDLTGMRGLAPPGPDFVGWLRKVIAHRRSLAPEQVRADIRAGLAECLSTGATLLGDISGDGGSFAELAVAPVRAVVFREVLGLPEERARAAWEGFASWREALPPSPTCRPAVGPHAPYSVRASLYRAAGACGLPVTTHLAESRAELELLAGRSGPFVPFLEELGVWDAEGLVEGPEQVLELCQALAPVLLAHGNYLSPDAPLPANATVVYCPRTHTAFGHAPHPFRAFLARGVRVALGTDGLASNPDLDVLAEARFVHRLAPDFPGAGLLRAITLDGARALGWEDEAGSLEAGKSADLVVVHLPDEESADPHRLVFASDLPVRATLFQGEWRGPPP